MKIKLSAFSDEAGNSFVEQVKALKENNMEYTELRGIDSKTVNTFSIEDAKLYRKKFDDAGIKVWSLGCSLGKDKINEIDFKAYQDRAKLLYEIANILGTKKVRAFSFYEAYNERNKVMDYLSKLVELATDAGVDYCHENEKDIYGDNAERVLDILNNVKDIKCVYDPANFIQTGEKAENTLSKIHSHADYFHIKDVIEATQEIVPAGYGDGQISKLIEMIEGEKVLSVEPHLGSFIGYANIDNTALKNKFYFKSNREAFDKAISSIKELIEKAGYKEAGKEFNK